MSDAADNGWTGGQYSVFRAALALSTIPFLWRVVAQGGAGRDALGPWFPNVLDLSAGSWLPVALASAGTGLAAIVAAGRLDRAAALLLAAALLCVRDAVPVPPGVAAWPVVESLLVLHALTPPAPYGSLAARGRPDPAGDWELPGHLHAAAWIVVGLAHLAVGATALLDAGLWEAPTGTLVALAALAGFEVLVLPLALIERLRPYLWLALLALGLGLALLLPLEGAGAMTLAAHLLLADPAWLRRREGAPEVVYYDGACGLCHRTVRFVLAEDAGGAAFRFAPLQGDAFARRVPPEVRADLPDSIIVGTADGRLLQRSRAVLHLLDRLGGLWRLVARAARVVPHPVADAVYDGVARIRHRLFRAPEAACPLLPPHLRERFVE